MKIAILSDDGITIAQHGGRAAGCLVFDTDNPADIDGEFRPLSPQECDHRHDGHHAHGGHAPGHNHGHILRLVKDCQLVISGGMGRRLRDDLQCMGVQAMTTDVRAVRQALELSTAGKLIPSLERDCGHH